MEYLDFAHASSRESPDITNTFMCGTVAECAQECLQISQTDHTGPQSAKAASDVTRGLDIHSFDAGTYRRQLTANAHLLHVQKLVVQKPFPDLVRHV